MIGWSRWQKWMKKLVWRTVSRWMGDGNSEFILSKGTSSENVLLDFYQNLPIGRKDTLFGVIWKKLLVGWHLLNYEEMFRGNTDLYKVCCNHYCHFYIYACHWIILSYTTLFIYWMFLCLLTSLSPLQVCDIYLTRFKEFSTFFPCSFVDPSVKGTYDFWKIRGLIDGFNESHRKIASGV